MLFFLFAERMSGLWMIKMGIIKNRSVHKIECCNVFRGRLITKISLLGIGYLISISNRGKNRSNKNGTAIVDSPITL